MKAESLIVYPRSLTKRTGVKKLRTQERVPAVMYGTKVEPQNLEINQRDIEHLYSHSVSEILLVELTINGKEGETKPLAMVQEVQHHPLSGKILHVLDHALQKVRVRGSVRALPEIITIDVSSLNQGDTLSVKDLPCPEGVTILADPSLTVFSITAPVEEIESTTAEGEEESMNEPEVIREKKPVEE